MLVEVDILNKTFQDEHVDITMIGRNINLLIDLLKARYLGSYFGGDCKHLKELLKQSRGSVFSYKNNEGDIIEHVLKCGKQRWNLTSRVSLQEFFLLTFKQS